jgi:RimJ/RimL family protein N-acetyltransferase
LADEVLLRDVIEEDLPVFFEHQLDPEATRMAAFPSRSRAAFMAHWRTKILSEEANVAKAVVVDGRVAGNVGSWEQSGKREIGYWIGREFWGRGVATKAVSAFLGHERTRPLYAHVAEHNVASIRVLQKCGFAPSDEAVASSHPDDGINEIVLKLDEDEGPGP